MTLTEHDTASELDNRYGRTPSTNRRNRVIFIVAVAAFAAVFGAWLLWAGLFAPAATLQTRDTGYANVTENSIDVSFSLTIDPGTATKCAVQALNESFSPVGWVIIDVPGSENRTRELTQTVRTTELPTTGLIYRCWLA